VKAPTGARNDNVVSLPPRDRAPVAAGSTPDLEPLGRIAAPGTPLHEQLVAIMQADSSFDPEHFLTGARAAYEMIVVAFAEGSGHIEEPAGERRLRRLRRAIAEREGAARRPNSPLSASRKPRSRPPRSRPSQPGSRSASCPS
jgi:predicted lipid-binding transport protein (Tim44 family)